MTEQDQTPQQDEDTEGHSFRLGKTADRRKDDDETTGHVRPPLDTGDDATGHAVRGAEDATDDDTEGHRFT